MGVISVPSDEYQARVELIAWLAYPSNERLRLRAKNALRDLARLHLAEKPLERRDRLDPALQAIDKQLDRHLFAGEIFRQQLFDAFGAKYGLASKFDGASTKATARRIAEHKKNGDENNERRIMRGASPIVHLAIGACDGLDAQPKLLTGPHPSDLVAQAGVKIPGLLLNDERHWTTRAVQVAQEQLRMANLVNHPRANYLLAVSIFDPPTAA
jgi:hypothetical protein